MKKITDKMKRLIIWAFTLIRELIASILVALVILKALFAFIILHSVARLLYGKKAADEKVEVFLKAIEKAIEKAKKILTNELTSETKKATT